MGGDVLGRQRVKYEVRVLVDAHQIIWLQFRGIHKTNHRQKDRLSGGRLDDGTFAFSLVIQVHGCTFLVLFVITNVQQLKEYRWDKEGRGRPRAACLPFKYALPRRHWLQDTAIVCSF